MPNDSETAKSAFAKLHQRMEATDRLTGCSCLSVTDQIERMTEPYRRCQLEIRRAFPTPTQRSLRGGTYGQSQRY